MNDGLYQAVVSRRLQFDNLVWQVPLLSLTAQAFLFTIALSGDSSRTARAISAGLWLVVTFLSITLMARHRQAEISDAHWLRDDEELVLDVDEDWRTHGEVWRNKRDVQGLDAGWIGRAVPLLPGFKTWVVGLALFGVAALVVLVLAVVAPDVLETTA